MKAKLEIAHIAKIGKVNENVNKYVAHIGVVDADNDNYTPYQSIYIDAHSEEFARRIAQIRVEEIIASDCDGIFTASISHQALLSAKDKHFDKYVEVSNMRDKLWTAEENALGAFIKDAQTDIDEGLDIRSFCIKVDVDGNEPMLVYAIRNWVDDSAEWVELLVTFSGDEDDLEWISIYDCYCGTAGDILRCLMDEL